MIDAEDGRTPEERLLARRRLGTAYLADVRALIARAEDAEAMLAEYLALQREHARQSPADTFGTIRTTVLPDE